MYKNQKALIRQTTILNRLNVGETVNVKELAEEFGVKVRTIQKDINERLALYNIENLGHGNYRFAKGYRLGESKKEEENIALSLMVSLQQSAVPQMDEYVKNVLSISNDYKEMFLFDLDFEPIKDFTTLKVILQAIGWKTGVEFIYHKKDGVSKEVAAHPYKIANFQSFWYLIAYDLVDKKIKTYHLNSISRLRSLYENFIPDKYEETEKICSNIDSAYYKKELYSTKLQLINDAKLYLLRHLPKNMELLKEEDNKAVVKYFYRHENELLGIVKKWLPDIQIIDNEELSKKLSTILYQYLGIAN